MSVRPPTSVGSGVGRVSSHSDFFQIAKRIDSGNIHVNDQGINDEAHVPFSGTKASGLGGYNSDDFLDEVTEKKWISLQHEPREFPF